MPFALVVVVVVVQLANLAVEAAAVEQVVILLAGLMFQILAQ
jgi:hypothetical protein